MPPQFATFDQTDGLLADSKVSSDATLWTNVITDGQNLDFSQLCLRITGSFSLPISRNHVSGVIETIAPTKMLGIEARRIIARMERPMIRRLWLRFTVKHQGNMMDLNHPIFEPYKSIAVRIASKRPLPTLGAVAVGKRRLDKLKSIALQFNQGIAVTHPALVVHFAPTAGLMLFIAAFNRAKTLGKGLAGLTFVVTFGHRFLLVRNRSVLGTLTRRPAHLFYQLGCTQNA